MSGRAYILCIDDEQPVLNQLSAQISRQFGQTHRVECSESAEEALDLMREIEAAGDEVHLVICDQVMPGMKGDRFLEAVSTRFPETMKVLLTGQAGLDAAIYAINRAGLHRYLEKPWEAEDLNITVRNLLMQYQLRREVERQHERLTRRDRELRSLHDVGHALVAAVEPETVLALVAPVAAGIARARAAAVVARCGVRETTLWHGHAGSLGDEARASLERSLERCRSENRIAGPDPIGVELLPVPIAQGSTLWGWILLTGAPAPCADTVDLLSILAGLAATRLQALRLLEERLGSERLTTIGRMISTIVHDFRNPMTAIKGFVGMIAQIEMPRETLEEYGHMILEEIDAMSRMIDEVLEFTRGGQTPLHLGLTTVDELATRVRRLIEPAFEAKGVAFRTELAYSGPIVVDLDRMKRALLNVASNALDATAPGGCFTIGARMNGGTLELAMEDTGCGIPENLQERIFEPFFTHGKTRGIGLGMAITRKIVEDHGGRIRVESRPGEGARFVLALPAQTEQQTKDHRGTGDTEDAQRRNGS
jgi:signal transduction histidine kinase